MHYIGIIQKTTGQFIGLVESGVEYQLPLDIGEIETVPIFVPELEEVAPPPTPQRPCQQCQTGTQYLSRTCCAEAAHGLIAKWQCDKCGKISYVKKKRK